MYPYHKSKSTKLDRIFRKLDMTKGEAEERINEFSVKMSEYQAEDYKERARESKLRADLVQLQIDQTVETLKLLKKQNDSLSLGSLTPKNPYSS